MKRKWLFLTVGICLLVALTTCIKEPGPFEPEQYLKVGDLRPGGGWVFYDKGDDTGGWRYLEADTDNFFAEWGLNGVVCDSTYTDLFKGEHNTIEIFRQIIDNFEDSDDVMFKKATQLCLDSDNLGYTDWFMPSRDELNLMYQNLHLEGYGDFDTSGTPVLNYWTSSVGGDQAYEESLISCWIQNFADGLQLETSDRSQRNWVRAIRRFK